MILLKNLSMRKMKLIKFSHREDYGHDWYLQVLFTKRWALFQGSVSWCEYPGWPYLQVTSGMGKLISVMFQVHRFGFDVGFLERTWNFERWSSNDETL